MNRRRRGEDREGAGGSTLLEETRRMLAEAGFRPRPMRLGWEARADAALARILATPRGLPPAPRGRAWWLRAGRWQEWADHLPLVDRQVLELMAQGLSITEIAAVLGLDDLAAAKRVRSAKEQAWELYQRGGGA